MLTNVGIIEKVVTWVHGPLEEVDHLVLKNEVSFKTQLDLQVFIYGKKLEKFQSYFREWVKN